MNDNVRIIFDNGTMYEYYDKFTDTLMDELRRVDDLGIDLQFCDIRKWAYHDGRYSGYVLWESYIDKDGKVRYDAKYTAETFEQMACHIDEMRLGVKASTDVVDMAEKKLGQSRGRRRFGEPHFQLIKEKNKQL